MLSIKYPEYKFKGPTILKFKNIQNYIMGLYWNPSPVSKTYNGKKFDIEVERDKVTNLNSPDITIDINYLLMGWNLNFSIPPR